MTNVAGFLYNEKLKKRYIERYNSKDARYVIERFLKRVGPIESELGRDMCQMSIDEMQTLLARVSTGAASFRYTIVSYIGKYCKWCIGEQVPGAHNIIKQCKFHDLDNFRKKMVASPSHLLTRMDENLTHSVEECSTDDIARMYMWFAYMGMTKLEATTVTNDDIDLKTMTVKLGSNQYPIYRECLPALANCMERKTFYVYLNSKRYERDRVQGTRVLRSSASPRGTVLDNDDPDVLVMRLRKSIRNLGVGMTFDDVRKSGVFRRAYESEIVSPITDPYTVFRSYVMTEFNKGTLDRYVGRPDDLKVLVTQRCKEAYEDYSRWLLAFGF